MSRWIKVDETINRYITDHLEPEIEVLRALREETSKLKQAGMQISHEQARFMTVVLSAMQARLTIEIGVFTGYSTLVTALTLPLDGRVLACDISQEWTRIAQPYWQLGGVADKIDLQLAPATETLDRLLNAGRQGEFDFVFIDADKTGYDDYYERSLQLLRPGGLIMIDNSLWNGSVLDASNTEQDTVAIRKLNEKISQDGRVLSYLAPIGDGIYMISKR
jgi:predicted O-methyltransferase YrrM